MSEQVTLDRIFSALADRHSVNILKLAYSGFKASSNAYVGNISKKQFYVRLKRLKNAGLIEKRGNIYITTTFGSLVCNSHIKTLEEMLANFWSLKAVDVLKAREDFPLHQKESVISEILQNSNLKSIVNSTHLSGFSVAKDYNHLVAEVVKLLGLAQKEVFLATRYHDPNFAKIIFKKISEGLTVHMLDSLPEQISVENRLNAILRTPPNRETFEMVNGLIKSPWFDLRKGEIPASFMVVDGRMVCYEATNYSNPEEFTLAISHYDDPYLAQRLISYYNSVAKNAAVPKLLASVRER
jgi:predicted transcriptional regulator